MNMQPITVNTKRACQLLGISYAAFWKLTKTGILKALPNFKRNKLYRVADLVAFANGENKGKP